MERKHVRNTVEFQVRGKYALFSDPVTRTGGEHCSSHIPTYEALKGILQSVFWTPAIKWVIDEARVLNPIQMESRAVRQLSYQGGVQLAYHTYLKDVAYQVRAHFVQNRNRPEPEGGWNENQYYNMARRLIRRGGRRDVFLGTRECQGNVEPCIFGKGPGYYDSVPGTMDFGFSYHGITYADEAELEEDRGKMTVRFWRPVMRRGYIRFCPPEACLRKRHIREMEIRYFPDRKRGEAG